MAALSFYQSRSDQFARSATLQEVLPAKRDREVDDMKTDIRELRAEVRQLRQGAK